MTQEVFNVEATALFYERPELDKLDLLGALNKQFENRDGCYLTLSTLSHDTWWLLCCEQFHIMISFSDKPAQQDKLRFASGSEANTLSRFDYTHAAQSHRGFIRVEIGDGNAPLPPEARKIMQEFGEAKSCDPALKMIALHRAAQQVCANAGFLALHFGPSDRLFSTEDLNEAAKQDYPAELLFHPVPTLPERASNGKEGWRLYQHNPDLSRGIALELEGIPVSVPLSTAVQLLRTLSRAHNNGKLSLPHGKVLTPSEKIALYTRHAAPDAEHDMGRVILSFWADGGHDTPAPDMTPFSLQALTGHEEAETSKSRRITVEDLQDAPSELAGSPSTGDALVVPARPFRAKLDPGLARGRAAAASRRMRHAHKSEPVTLDASPIPRSVLARLFGKRRDFDSTWAVMQLDGARIAGVFAMALASLAASPTGLHANLPADTTQHDTVIQTTLR